MYTISRQPLRLTLPPGQFLFGVIGLIGRGGLGRVDRIRVRCGGLGRVVSAAIQPPNGSICVTPPPAARTNAMNAAPSKPGPHWHRLVVQPRGLRGGAQELQPLWRHQAAQASHG